MIDNPERTQEIEALSAAFDALERPLAYQVAQNENDFVLPNPDKPGYMLWHDLNFTEPGTSENILHISDFERMRTLGESLLEALSSQSLEDLATGNVPDVRSSPFDLDSRTFPGLTLAYDGKQYPTDIYGSIAASHEEDAEHPCVRINASVVNNVRDFSYGKPTDTTSVIFNPLAEGEDRMLFVRTMNTSTPPRTQMVQPGTPTWQRSIERIAHFAKLATEQHDSI